MADRKQSGRPLQFGDTSGANRMGDTAHCGQCEAMLADAIDGTLSAEGQALFDAHMAACSPCAQLLADASRGAAFLDILRDPAPEPPPALLERILILTSGGLTSGGIGSEAHDQGLAHLPAAAFVADTRAGYPNILPFPTGAAAAYRRSSLREILLQPRLAMTAAMAFLSIALTLDLTGVRLQSLQLSDLQPSSLKRDFYTANARVVQYYEGLRVVYELESRVRDFEDSNSTDSEAPGPDTNAAPAAQEPAAQQPAPPNAPSGLQPTQRRGPSAQPPRKLRPRASGPAPDPGSSRREEINPSRPLLPLANRNANSEGGLA